MKLFTHIKWLFLTLMLCIPMLSLAEEDPRMLIHLVADEEKGITVQQLHTNIAAAADLALPVVWQRMLSEEAIASLPANTRGGRFLQRATPTEDGIDITFSSQRIQSFLDKQGITAFSTEQAQNADIPETPAPNETVQTPAISDPTSISPRNYLTLSIERPASLPEQVLFEEDLKRDPRILDLSLLQVNSDGQKYRLLLVGADDQWMMEWFNHHGLTLKPTIEGWVAQSR